MAHLGILTGLHRDMTEDVEDEKRIAILKVLAARCVADNDAQPAEVQPGLFVGMTAFALASSVAFWESLFSCCTNRIARYLEPGCKHEPGLRLV